MKKYLILSLLTIFFIGSSLSSSFARSIDPIPVKSYSLLKVLDMPGQKAKSYIIKYTITKAIGPCNVTITGYAIVTVDETGHATCTFPTPTATVICEQGGAKYLVNVRATMQELFITDINFESESEVVNDNLNSKEFKNDFLEYLNKDLQSQMANDK